MEAFWGVAVLFSYSIGMVILGFILGRRGQAATVRHQPPATVAQMQRERGEGYCLCGHSGIYHSGKNESGQGCHAIDPKRSRFDSVHMCRCVTPREEIAQW